MCPHCATEMHVIGDLGGGVSWQRFIARLMAHGPLSTLVPGSILQETSCTYTLLGVWPTM